MSLAMTKEEREAFLAETRVGVLSVSQGNGAAPLTAPLWYSYEPGGLVTIITSRATRKAPLLRAAGKASLCVQSDTVPYSYVTVEGSVVSMDGPVDVEERRALSYRYLGAEMGEAYMAATVDEVPNEVVVRIKPERWYSVDYSKMPL